MFVATRSFLSALILSRRISMLLAGLSCDCAGNTRTVLFALALDLLGGLFSRRLGFHDQLVGDVVLVDVADISHRLRTDFVGGYVLDVVEPDVWIQSAVAGFLAQLRNSARAGIVGREREQDFVQPGKLQGQRSKCLGDSDLRLGMTSG